MASLRCSWPMFSVIALAACFSDSGIQGGSATATATTTTTATGDATAAVTSAGSGDTTGSGGTTGVASATSTGPTGGVTTAEPVTGTTGSGMCGVAGEACGDGCCGCLVCGGEGTCVADDAACGDCRVCDGAGECALVPESTACTVADEACAAMVWGPGDGTCHRYAGRAGTCDAAGACVPGECGGMGAAIASCQDARCMLAGACVQGAPADEVSVESLCKTDGPTPECSVKCVTSGGFTHADVTTWACAPEGACVQIEVKSCGGYVCKDDVSCLTMCDSDQDCAFNHACFEGQCVLD